MKRKITLLVAWSLFALGTLISMTLNVINMDVIHSSGGLIAKIIAASWPLLATGGVALLTHVHWPRGWPWVAARFGGGGVLALGAMVVSYAHGHGVLVHWSYDTLSATVGPLIIDGLEIVASVALLATHARKTPVRPARRGTAARKTATRRKTPAVRLATA